MTDRTVSVTLQAKVAGFIAEMKTAGKGASAAFGESLKITEQQRHALGEVSTAMGLFGAAALAAGGLAIKTFADFDARMSQVKSLAHATGGEMQALREAALTAGQDIGFSASEAADAELELVKAGVSVREIMGGGLRGALTLAAAGQIEVAQATEIAAIAMTQFGVAGSEVPHVADLLAAGADKALGGVDELGMALKQSGLVASQFGLSIEETVGALAAFANAGLLGSDAGTSFKTMLQRLSNPSGEAASQMEELGINAYDAQGNFVGLVSLSGQLHDSLSKLPPAQRNAALSIIFGSDAIRAANVLYREGAKGIQGWINGVNEQGFAVDQAAGKMDNLEGDLQKLKAALENDLIRAGSGANDALRTLTQGATSFVQVIGEIPGPVLQTGLGLTLLVGTLALVGAGMIKTVQYVSQMREAISTAREAIAQLLERMAATGAVGNRMAGLIKANAGLIAGGFTAALAVGTIALAFFAQKHAEAKARVQELTHAVEADTGAIAKNTRAVAVQQLQQQGALDAARRLGISLSDVTDAALGNAAAQNRVNEALNQLSRRSTSIGGVHSKQARDVEKVRNAYSLTNKELQKAVEAYRNAKEAGSEVSEEEAQAAKTAADLANATGAVSEEFEDAKSAADQYKDALDALNGSAQSAEQANLDYRDQLVETRKELQHGAKTLNVNTEEGRKNRRALLDGVKAAQEHASAVVDETGSVEQGNAVLRRHRSQLINAAVAAGMSRDAATRYIDKLLKIPKNVKTDVRNNAGGLPKKKAEEYLRLIGRIPRYLTTHVTFTSSGVPRGTSLHDITGATGGLYDGKRFRYDQGGEVSGLVKGPGTGTSDSIPAPWLSNGEFVMREWAVGQIGEGVLAYANKYGRLPGDGYAQPMIPSPRGHANGGLVSGVTPETRVTVLLDGRAIEPRMVKVITAHDRETKRNALAGTGRAR